jgi:hypothetical protein
LSGRGRAQPRTARASRHGRRYRRGLERVPTWVIVRADRGTCERTAQALRERLRARPAMVRSLSRTSAGEGDCAEVRGEPEQGGSRPATRKHSGAQLRPLPGADLACTDTVERGCGLRARRERSQSRASESVGAAEYRQTPSRPRMRPCAIRTGCARDRAGRAALMWNVGAGLTSNVGAEMVQRGLKRRRAWSGKVAGAVGCGRGDMTAGARELSKCYQRQTQVQARPT